MTLLIKGAFLTGQCLFSGWPFTPPPLPPPYANMYNDLRPTTYCWGPLMQGILVAAFNFKRPQCGSCDAQSIQVKGTFHQWKAAHLAPSRAIPLHFSTKTAALRLYISQAWCKLKICYRTHNKLTKWLPWIPFLYWLNSRRKCPSSLPYAWDKQQITVQPTTNPFQRNSSLFSYRLIKSSTWASKGKGLPP